MIYIEYEDGIITMSKEIFPLYVNTYDRILQVWLEKDSESWTDRKVRVSMTASRPYLYTITTTSL